MDRYDINVNKSSPGAVGSACPPHDRVSISSLPYNERRVSKHTNATQTCR